MPVRPDHFDRRVAFQQSCFTFHSRDHKELTTDQSKTLTMVRVPKAAKPKIRNELFLLGVDPFAIFGDLPNLAERLKAAYGIPNP